MKKKFQFILLLLLIILTITFSAFGQNLSISTSGETGTSGTNWAISGNTLNLLTSSGSATIHPSVITSHLNNIGDLTIVTPSSSTSRSIQIFAPITYSGSVNRTLTFKSANAIIFSTGANVSSTNAALNVIIWADNSTTASGEGRVSLTNINITTNNGHLWIGGGSTASSWNGLTTGNGPARTWNDDIPGLTINGCSINTGSGNLSAEGLSFESSDNNGYNTGTWIENSTITSTSGSISFVGNLQGRYTNGLGLVIMANTGNNTFSTTSGNITFSAIVSDAPNNDNGWRNALALLVTNGRSINIGTTSGNIMFAANANYDNSTINDAEAIVLTAGNTARSINITSQTGNIAFQGTNSRTNTGVYCNGVRFTAADVTGSISIGSNGINPHSGNISIITDALLQRNDNSGSGSITLNTIGNIYIEPYLSSTSFVYLRASNNTGASNTLTFNDDWNFGSATSGITFGKSGNTFPLTLSNAITTNGILNIFAGAITLNANLSSTNNSTGDITIQGSTFVGTGTINLPNTRTLTLNLSSNSTFGGAINGTGANLVKTGAGATTLSVACGYTGSTTVNGGTLQFNENEAFNAVTIANGATLALGPNKQFDLNASFTNNGTLNLKSGATILHGGSNTISGTGSYVVEQAITGTNSGGTPNGRFWYLGSPVVGASSSVYFANAANVLKKRNETNNSWIAITNAAPENLEVGKGYYTQSTANSTLSFAGSALNNGAISISGLTRTAGQNFEGFNLVANPYPSYLDWDAVTKTNVGNTMWYRTASGSTAASMVFETYVAGAAGGIGTNLSGNVATKWIPPMQSFWVRVAQGQTSGSIALDNTMRAHFTSVSGSTAGLRSTNDELKLFLRMNLLQADKKDQLIVYANGNATNGFDVLDGEKMMQSTLPQFYTAAAGKKITINGLNSAKKQQALPITMELPTTGVHSFVIEDLEIDNGLVWLEDKQEETLQALEPGTVYEFFANSGVNAERFVLHFQLLDTPTPTNTYNEVGSYANFNGKGASVHAEAAGVVVIKLPSSTEGNTDIQIRDAAGKLVYTGSTNTLETSVQLAQANGIYYVTLNSASGVEVRKVFVQQ